jgi:hypothetical protein
LLHTVTPRSAVIVPDLLVLTWNLQRNMAAARLAVEHLGGWIHDGVSWIATFQEPPVEMGALLAGSTPFTAHLPSTKHNLILTSRDVRVDPEGPLHSRNPVIDTNQRMEGRTFASEHWSGLRFLAVHGEDRRTSPSPGDRQEWAMTVRKVLGSFWTAPGPLIVAGDLNANPWHHEVTYRRGWFAGRTAERPGERCKLKHEADHAERLVNTMWKVVGRAKTPGTWHGDHGGVLWHCLDQVLVSQGLFDERLAPVVRESMVGQALIDASGEPLWRYRKPGKHNKTFTYSDHLPVELLIPGDRVTSACTPKQPK